MDMDTEVFENRGVDMDMDTEFCDSRGADMDVDTEFFGNRGVDMDTAWNRCPPNSGSIALLIQIESYHSTYN